MEKLSYLESTFRELEKIPNWIVAYSGGKDSTLVLHFAINYSLKRGNKVFVINSDTLVENPIMKHHVQENLKKIETYIKNNKLPHEIKVVTPETDETFWVQVIGKGYPLPHIRFRWCQRVLKIKPVQKFLKSLNPSECVLLLGHRMDESSIRSRVIQGNNNLSRYGKIPVYMPILYFREEDVWNFLATEKCFWDGNFESLIEIYKDAKGECPLIIVKNKEENNGVRKTCGGRFGCWVCTLVKDDWTMLNLIKKHEEMKPYYEFRKWLIDFCNIPENRYPFTRTGKPVKMGCLTHKGREIILNKVLSLQSLLSEDILTKQELVLIDRFWENR